MPDVALKWLLAKALRHLTARLNAGHCPLRMGKVGWVWRLLAGHGKVLGAQNDLAFDAASDEALFVGLVVQGVKFFGGGLKGSANGDFGGEDDLGHGIFAVVCFGEEGLGIVVVAVYYVTLGGGEDQKPEHVAAGDSSGQGFFGIDCGRIAVGGRDNAGGSAARNDGAAIEAPRMGPAIFFVDKRSFATFPDDIDPVLGHAIGFQR